MENSINMLFTQVFRKYTNKSKNIPYSFVFNQSSKNDQNKNQISKLRGQINDNHFIYSLTLINNYTVCCQFKDAALILLNTDEKKFYQILQASTDITTIAILNKIRSLPNKSSHSFPYNKYYYFDKKKKSLIKNDLTMKKKVIQTFLYCSIEK